MNEIGLLYSTDWTGLTDWTGGLSWKQLLNNNPGIIHLLQHWRHHYRAITVGTALPYKSDELAHALINYNTLTLQKKTYDTRVLAVIKRDRGYCCSVHVFLCCFNTWGCSDEPDYLHSPITLPGGAT